MDKFFQETPLSETICTGEAITPLDRLHRKALEQNIPLQVYLELTYQCNERCTFCYNPSTRVVGLSFEQLKRPLAELAEMGGFYLNLTGGEPLLHPEFFDIAAYGRELGYSLTVFTNGTLITPHRADRLAELRVTSFNISIHGSCASTHEAVTGLPGSFEKMLRGVRLLRERNQRVVLKMPLTRRNQSELRAVRELAATLGCELVTASHMSPTHDGRQSPLGHSPEYRALRVHYAPFFMDRRGMILPVRAYPTDAPNCSLGRSIIAISPEGDIYPCIQMPYRLGNVLTDSIRAIWSDDRKMGVYRSLRRRNMSPCHRCKIAAYCSVCPGIAYLGHGNPYRADLEACRDARGSYETYQALVTEVYMRKRKPSTDGMVPVWASSEEERNVSK